MPHALTSASNSELSLIAELRAERDQLPNLGLHLHKVKDGGAIAQQIRSLLDGGNITEALTQAQKLVCEEGISDPRILVAYGRCLLGTNRLELASMLCERLRAHIPRAYEFLQFECAVQRAEGHLSPPKSAHRARFVGNLKAPEVAALENTQSLIREGELGHAFAFLIRTMVRFGRQREFEILEKQVSVALGFCAPKSADDLAVAIAEGERVLESSAPAALRYLLELPRECRRYDAFSALVARAATGCDALDIARLELQRAIYASPDQIEQNCATLAGVELKRGNLGDAATYAEYALQLRPSNGRAHGTLAEIALIDGDSFDMRYHIEIALRDMPPTAKELFIMAVSEIISGNYRSAAFFSNRAMQGGAPVEKVGWLAALAIDLQTSEKTTKPSQIIFDGLADFIEQNPKIAIELWEGIGCVRYASSQIFRRLYDAYRNCELPIRAYECRALAHRLERNLLIEPANQCTELLNDMFRITQDVAAAVISRLARKDLDLAYEYGKEAIKLEPAGTMHYRALAEVCLQFGTEEMAEQARFYYGKMIEDRYGARVEALLYLATLHMQAEEFEEARGLIEQSLSIAPCDLNALSLAAQCELWGGDLKQAKALYSGIYPYLPAVAQDGLRQIQRVRKYSSH